MGEELDLAEYWGIIKKNKKKIILIPLLLVLITAVVSLAWPKTYESESVIQIGKIKEDIFSIEEAKTIVKSSTIVNPVIEKFYIKKDKMSLKKFNEKVLDVQLVTERISVAETRATNFFSIKVKAGTPERAKEINEEIINQFFLYSKPKYEVNLDLIQKELSNTEDSVRQLKTSIEEIEKEIKQKGALEEDSSDLVVLRTLLSSNTEKLIELEDKKIGLLEVLNNKREFNVISYPQVPIKYSKPNLAINLAVALVFGVLLSWIVVFSKKQVLKR